jgi:hypothetical protein
MDYGPFRFLFVFVWVRTAPVDLRSCCLCRVFAMGSDSGDAQAKDMSVVVLEARPSSISTDL